MDCDYSMEHLNQYPYSYLQKIAKAMGIQANVKRDYLIQLIYAKKHHTVEKVERIMSVAKRGRQQQAAAVDKKKPTVRTRKDPHSHTQGDIPSTSKLSVSPPTTVAPQAIKKKNRTPVSQKYNKYTLKNVTKDRALRSSSVGLVKSNLDIMSSASEAVIGVIKVQKPEAKVNETPLKLIGEEESRQCLQNSCRTTETSSVPEFENSSQLKECVPHTTAAKTNNEMKIDGPVGVNLDSIRRVALHIGSVHGDGKYFRNIYSIEQLKQMTSRCEFRIRDLRSVRIQTYTRATHVDQNRPNVSAGTDTTDAPRDGGSPRAYGYDSSLGDHKEDFNKYLGPSWPAEATDALQLEAALDIRSLFRPEPQGDAAACEPLSPLVCTEQYAYKSPGAASAGGIEDMFDDAFDVITRDTDFMARVGMDIRMQCVLCSWAGPNIVMEYHIRKEHPRDIRREAAGGGAWRVELSPSELRAGAGAGAGARRVLGHGAALYVLRARLRPPARFMATLAKFTCNPEKESASLTVSDGVTGESRSWEGEVLEVSPDWPEEDYPGCLVADLPALGPVLARADPAAPDSPARVSPAAPGSPTRAGLASPGSPAQASPMAPDSPTRADPTAPGSPTRAILAASGSPTRVGPVATDSPTRTSPVAPGSPTQAGPAVPGSPTQASLAASGSPTQAGPATPDSPTRADPVAPDSFTRVHPAAPGTPTRAGPVASDSSASPPELLNETSIVVDVKIH